MSRQNYRTWVPQEVTIFHGNQRINKKALYLCVNVFSTKVTSWGHYFYVSYLETGRTAILRGHPSHAKVFTFAGQRHYLLFSVIFILGDPGTVSRVGRKGGTKVFKYGQKSPWVPTLTELFPKIQDAGS